MDWFKLTGYSIIQLTQIIISAGILAYMCFLRKKSKAIWQLIGFFVGVTWYFIAIFLFSTVNAHWQHYFLLPTQIIGFFVGMIFMLQFFYQFPEPSNRKESQIVLFISIISAVLIIIFIIFSFMIDRHFGLIDYQIIGFVLLLMIIWGMIVLYRRTINYADDVTFNSYKSLGNDKSQENQFLLLKKPLFSFRKLTKTKNKKALATRGFLMVTCLGFLLNLATIITFVSAMTPELNQFILGIGFQVFLFVAVMNYFNHVPEPSTFILKIVGVSLLSVLVVVGIVAFIITPTHIDSYNALKNLEVELCKNAINSFEFEIVPENVSYIMSNPGKNNIDEFSQLVYSKDNNLDLSEIIKSEILEFSNEIEELTGQLFLFGLQNNVRVNSEYNQINFITFEFTGDDNTIYEIGYNYDDYRSFLHKKNSGLALIIIVTTIIMAITLPLFFQSSLVAPLNKLLEGVKKVDEGDFDVEIPVKVQDEIGIISRSFNKMVASVKKANELRVQKARIDTELKTAHDAQMSIMPQTDPDIDGFEISGICIPANEVGGDFFDYIWLDEQKTKFGITICDVSGKGMKAAMTAVMSSGMLYTKANETDSIKEIMTRVNRPLFFKTEKSMFAAMCLASINTKSKKLIYTNAGLNEPLLKRNNTIQVLKGENHGYPLGIVMECEYRETSLTLTTGDVLLLCTDGLTEAENQTEEFYGDERLRDLLLRIDTTTISAKEIKETIIKDIDAFTGSSSQSDDMTLVVVKVL